LHGDRRIEPFFGIVKQLNVSSCWLHGAGVRDSLHFIAEGKIDVTPWLAERLVWKGWRALPIWPTRETRKVLVDPWA